MFTLDISGIAWLEVSVRYRWPGSALRHRDHRHPRRSGAGCDCHRQTAAVWSVVWRWVCRGEAGSPPTGAGRAARWSVHRWCCHCWVACGASWLPVSPASKAWGDLADQDWRWEFDATPALKVDRRADGPRVRFWTFDHRSDGLPSILRCQGGMECVRPPLIPAADVHGGRARLQFHSIWDVNCRERGRCYSCSTGQAVLEWSD